MAKITNVGLFVSDLAAAKAFFEDVFDAKEHCAYNEEENNYYSFILDLSDGPRIELMTKPEIVNSKKDCNRTGWAHICIKVEGKERLDEIVAKFHAAGYKMLYEPATVGGKECRAITFEDNVIEVCY